MINAQLITSSIETTNPFLSISNATSFRLKQRLPARRLPGEVSMGGFHRVWQATSGLRHETIAKLPFRQPSVALLAGDTV